jgi:hypothetical protein
MAEKSKDFGWLEDDDIFLGRDGDGELIPMEQVLPESRKKVLVTPMTWGEARVFSRAIASSNDLPTQQIQHIFSQHVKRPDLSGISQKQIEKDMKPGVIVDLINVLMDVSGISVRASVGGTGQIVVEELEGNA